MLQIASTPANGQERISTAYTAAAAQPSATVELSTLAMKCTWSSGSKCPVNDALEVSLPAQLRRSCFNDDGPQ